MNMILQAALRQRCIQRRAAALQSVPVTHMMRITGTHPYAVQVMCSRTIMMRKGSGMQSRRTGKQRTSCTGSDGSIRNHYRYSAFGETITAEETVPNRLRYNEQMADGLNPVSYTHLTLPTIYSV